MANDPVANVLKQIYEQHDLVIKRLGDGAWPKVERIPSGSVSLDAALGGGWPRGRFAEIYGPQSSGKTLISLVAIAQAQKLGGRAAFVDVEHAFDPVWAAGLGVDVDNLYFTQPDNGEQALNAVHDLAISNQFDVIVLDSVAELLPKAQLEAEIGKQTMGLQARMMSDALRKLGPAVGKSKAIVLFINQTRTKIGIVYGDPTTTPGGDAFKFYASIRISAGRENKSERFDANKEIIGHNIKISIKKNKTAPPFKIALIPIEYLKGVLVDEDLINAATSRGIVTWSGGVKYTGTKVTALAGARWPSWDEFRDWVRNPKDPSILVQLTEEIKQHTSSAVVTADANQELPVS